MFCFPILGILVPRALKPNARKFMYVVFSLFLVIILGLRFEVGPDWNAYLAYYNRSDTYAFFELMQLGDPGYYFLNWLSAQIGGQVYLVNFVSAFFTVYGTMRFCTNQPLPWLAILVSIPYLLIVVGMGYTRQAIAISFVLLSFVYLSKSKTGYFIFWVIVAATFHKSAVIVLPIAALANSKNRLLSIFWLGTISAVGAYLFIYDSLDSLWSTYVEADYQSQGGLIRVLMNAVPAIIFIFLRHKLYLDLVSERLWWWMSLLSLVCIPLVLISSTATDRVALYLIPLQIFVFSRLHYSSKDNYCKALIVISIIAYYTAIQFVWLNFASHAYSWVPYNSLLIKK